MKTCLRFLAVMYLFSCLAVFLDSQPAVAETAVLAADEEKNWYRGNMHTHSLWSDGDDYLEMIALWYQKHDYQFLVFTDHNILADTDYWVQVKKSKGGAKAYGKLKVQFPRLVEERISDDGNLEVRLRKFDEVAKQFDDDGKFLLVQGEEISNFAGTTPVHVNVSNVAELIQPILGTASVFEVIQRNVRSVIDQREKTGQPMLVHLNHPNFQYAITAEDLMHVVGERFFEVYNGHPSVHNSGDKLHASTERIWDIINTWRLVELDLPMMFGLATDDGHEYHEKIPSKRSTPGRGWVEVLAKELTVENLIGSMEAGQFYASSGVSLKRIETNDKRMSIEVDAVKGETYKIEFIGTRKGFDATNEPVTDDSGKEIRTTRRYSKDIGETLALVEGPQAEYQFQGDELYVRARITSSAKHSNPAEPDEFQRAWCQPVVGPGLDSK